jgi:hypothetical protein
MEPSYKFHGARQGGSSQHEINKYMRKALFDGSRAVPAAVRPLLQYGCSMMAGEAQSTSSAVA